MFTPPVSAPVFTIVRTAAFEISAPENIVLAGLRPALNTLAQGDAVPLPMMLRTVYSRWVL